ncbi:MAG: Laccase domain protein YfiH [Alphaproteobacteria bacterium MarineAlpha2_Bin1]|nr:MAG: Laccase domain protein YfiH [Alphaproteobacteria bacterium MarineAlpha2_Bin1]
MEKKFFTSQNLTDIPWLRHGFFTRNGGFSNGVFKSLNCSYGSSDNKQNVLRNRNLILKYFKIQNSSLYIPNQVHGTKVEIITSRNCDTNISADALITNKKEIVLGILTADCAPLLIVDKNKKIIANIHCGWKGTLNGIIENTINKLVDMGSKKEDLISAIGPCISSSSYEVKNDFIEKFKKNEKNFKDYFIFKNKKSTFFNLPLYIKEKLLNNRLRNISVLNIDTYSNEKNFFSYRRSAHKKESDYGRQLTILSIIN